MLHLSILYTIFLWGGYTSTSFFQEGDKCYFSDTTVSSISVSPITTLLLMEEKRLKTLIKLAQTFINTGLLPHGVLGGLSALENPPIYALPLNFFKPQSLPFIQGGGKTCEHVNTYMVINTTRNITRSILKMRISIFNNL